MTAPFSRLVAIDGTHNIRDLGGAPCRDGRQVRRGRVFRACGMSGLTAEGHRTLTGLGIGHVIDLRSAAERETDPGPFGDHPGTVHVPVFDGLAPVVDTFAADGFAAFGTRYVTALESGAPRFGQAFRAVAAARAEDDAPLLFHCTAGKDRTGVMAALLLDLLGVDRSDIVADYAATATLGAGLLARLSDRALARGADAEITARVLEARPRDMEHVLDWLDTRFQGAAGYLRAAGLTDEELDRIAATLITDPDETGRSDPGGAAPAAV